MTKDLKSDFKRKRYRANIWIAGSPKDEKQSSGAKEILKTITEENVLGIKMDFYSKEYYSAGEIYLENYHLCMYNPVK